MPEADGKSDLTEKLPFSQDMSKILILYWFYQNLTCDLSRRVCAQLFTIWTDVIDHFPA